MPVAEQQPTVLVVDDDSSIRDQMAEMLRLSGCRILTAGNGHEALEEMSRHPVDLVLTDLHMPEMDGFRLCREIVSDPANHGIPLVVMSGQRDRQDRLRCLEVGAMDFLNKPFLVGEVLAKVRNWINHRRLSDKWQHALQDLGAVFDYSERFLGDWNQHMFRPGSWLELMLEHIEKTAHREAEVPGCLLLLEQDKNGSRARMIDRGAATGIRDGDNSGQPNLAPDSCAAWLRFIDGRIRAVNLETAPPDQTSAVAGLLQGLEQLVPAIRNVVAVGAANRLVLAGINYPGQVEVEHGFLLKAALLHHAMLRTIDRRSRAVEEAFHYTSEALARAAEANDTDTGNHIIRVSSYSVLLAGALGLPAPLLDDLEHFAQMHDVGKIKIDRRILLKEGRLDPEEWEEMKRHTLYGVEILGPSPRLEVARQVALCHHECWDGSGYPHGLKGEEIPISARVVKMADVYDALRSPRSYKPGLTAAAAEQVILEGDDRLSPGSFDPAVLNAFMEHRAEMAAIYDRLADEP